MHSQTKDIEQFLLVFISLFTLFSFLQNLINFLMTNQKSMF